MITLRGPGAAGAEVRFLSHHFFQVEIQFFVLKTQKTGCKNKSH